MKTISFINHKGGAGKTTLCVNVAAKLTLGAENFVGHEVMAADADPQGTLRDWQEAGEGFSFNLLAADKRHTLNTVIKIADESAVDYLLIDTPGKMMDMIATVISLSDLIIVPLSPSPCDVWATMDTLCLIRGAMRANPKLKTMLVINQAIPNCVHINDTYRMLVEHASDFKVAEKPIIGRIAFARAGLSGKSIYNTSDVAAMKDISDLTDEMIKYLNE
jgi:chromosome partitioning protein